MSAIARHDPKSCQISKLVQSSFACQRCHQIRRTTPLDVNHWNQVITYLSGGLLYGREVPKPAEFNAEPIRRRRYIPQLTRQAPRRKEILRKLLDGWSVPRIAQSMGITRTTVYVQLRSVYRQEGVPNMEALIAKLRPVEGMGKEKQQCLPSEAEEVLVGQAIGHRVEQIPADSGQQPD